MLAPWGLRAGQGANQQNLGQKVFNLPGRSSSWKLAATIGMLRNHTRPFSNGVGPMARRHTILVVDDEPDVVQSVQDLLRLDYRVLGTTRATEGIKLLQEQVVHVVMTDLPMPDRTSVEFLRQIRGDHPDAIRLLFTAYTHINP